MPDAKPKPLFINQLLRQVHTALLDAQSERLKNNEAAIFEVDSLTLEVHFVAIEEASAKGGFDFKIVSAGVGQKFDEQQVHKVVLNLKGSSLTADEDADLPASSTAKFRPRLKDQ